MMDELRYSGEVEEILKKKPSGFVRWGIPAIGIFFLLLIISSYFISYPEGMDCFLFPDSTDDASDSSYKVRIDARIYIPESGNLQFTVGEQIQIRLTDCTNEPMDMEGIIMAADAGAGLLFIRFNRPPAESLKEALLNTPQGCRSILITGRSNILFRIFKPVVSQFNKTQKKPE